MLPEELDIIEKMVSRALQPVLDQLSEVKKRLDQFDNLSEKTTENRVKLEGLKERLQEHAASEEDAGKRVAGQIGELYNENKGLNQKLADIELKSQNADSKLKEEIVKSANGAAYKIAGIVSTAITVLGAIVVALIKG